MDCNRSTIILQFPWKLTLSSQGLNIQEGILLTGISKPIGFKMTQENHAINTYQAFIHVTRKV